MSVAIRAWRLILQVLHRGGISHFSLSREVVAMVARYVLLLRTRLHDAPPLAVDGRARRELEQAGGAGADVAGVAFAEVHALCTMEGAFRVVVNIRLQFVGIVLVVEVVKRLEQALAAPDAVVFRVDHGRLLADGAPDSRGGLAVVVVPGRAAGSSLVAARSGLARRHTMVRVVDGVVVRSRRGDRRVARAGRKAVEVVVLGDAQVVVRVHGEIVLRRGRDGTVVLMLIRGSAIHHGRCGGPLARQPAG